MDSKRTQSEYWSPMAWRGARRPVVDVPPISDQPAADQRQAASGKPPMDKKSSPSPNVGLHNPLSRLLRALSRRWNAFSRWFARLPRPLAAALLLSTFLI